MIFPRGTIVHHKVHGGASGTAINDVDVKGDIMVEVRMANGVIEKFFPEELESDETRKARWAVEGEAANRANQNRWGEDDPYAR